METGTAMDEGARAAKVAYDTIAPAYDDFTSHHEYDVWLGNLMPALERHGLQGDRLLDIACGTGKSFLPMMEKGWQVTAADISPEMLELAREKVGEEVEFHIADFTNLPKFGEFDLVFCLDDALNYLLSPDEMERALRGLASNLSPTGLLLFDINCLNAYYNFFAEEFVVEMNGRRLTWDGHAENAQPGSSHEATFRIESLEDPEAEPIEVPHRQRHFPETEMLGLLEAAGLEVLGIYGHRDDAILQQPVEEDRHFKMIYISRLASDR
jgi:SAM-dependent methyltransferase